MLVRPSEVYLTLLVTIAGRGVRRYIVPTATNGLDATRPRRCAGAS